MNIIKEFKKHYDQKLAEAYKKMEIEIGNFFIGWVITFLEWKGLIKRGDWNKFMEESNNQTWLKKELDKIGKSD